MIFAFVVVAALLLSTWCLRQVRNALKAGRLVLALQLGPAAMAEPLSLKDWHSAVRLLQDIAPALACPNSGAAAWLETQTGQLLHRVQTAADAPTTLAVCSQLVQQQVRGCDCMQLGATRPSAVLGFAPRTLQQRSRLHSHQRLVAYCCYHHAGALPPGCGSLQGSELSGHKQQPCQHLHPRPRT